MPPVEVVFYRDARGNVPLVEWLDRLPAKARDKCLAAVLRLEEMGHEARRPLADFLRDGIHELRVRLGTINYRLLYFFHGRTVVVLTHGLTKERAVPSREIELAIDRRRRFLDDPLKHTFAPETD
jgi:phage-related protein